MMKLKTILLVLILAVTACNEFEDPPPAAPILDPIPPSQFDIAGRWDGITDQGRPVRFDVNDQTIVIDGSLSLHHECSGGRLVLRLGTYEAEVSGDSFSATVNWRYDEDRRYYTGKLTVSGRFEGNQIAKGGFVNSITDKQADNLGVCNGVSGTWEASRK